MKIWTLTLNAESGIETEVYPTKEEAHGVAIEWAIGHWPEFMPASAIPAELGAIMDALDEAGFIDTVHITGHDISAHPAISGAIGALMLAADRLAMNGDEQEHVETMQEAFAGLQA